MKSIYNEYNAMKDPFVEEISVDFDNYVKTIFVKCLENGYNIREISHWLSGCLSTVEAEVVLRNAITIRKLEEKNKLKEQPINDLHKKFPEMTEWMNDKLKWLESEKLCKNEDDLNRAWEHYRDVVYDASKKNENI